MDPIQIMNDLVGRAEVAGLNIDALSKRSGVARSIIWRGREGKTEPRFSSLQRLERAVEEAEAQSEAV